MLKRIEYEKENNKQGSSNMKINNETIMRQCEKLALEIRKVKESKDVSAWRLRRLEKSLYNLASRL